MNQLTTINNVRCYMKDGTAYLNLEDVARGLGFMDGNSVRWARVHSYLEEIGYFARSGDTVKPSAVTETYIPENYFYRLAMKAKNETAEKFQTIVADEILPSIRKTGTYSTVDYSNLSPELQLFKTMFDSVANQQLRLQQTEQSLASIKETIVAIPDDWRASINRNLNAISRAVGPNEFKSVRSESYRLLENRGGCDLERRLMFLKARLETQGRSATEVKQANKLDVIEADKKLREIYQMIVKELTIKFVI